MIFPCWWMSLFDELDLGCMLKMLKIASMEVGLWNDGLRMMDYNSKLVAFGLSIWHYNFALDGL